MDPITEILRSLRLEGALVARAEGAGRWGVESQALPCALFHAVVSGTAHFRSGDVSIPLDEGDVLVLCRGDAHVLADREDTPPHPYASFPMTREGVIPTLHAGTQGERTSILCGSFTLQHAAAEHFTALLPRTIHISRARDSVAPWLDQSVRMLLESLEGEERGADAVATRVMETFFVHVLRTYFDTAPEDSHGWLAGLSDPRIAKALASIHQNPAESWTAAGLAARVGMSRSSFFSRFSELVGEPPVQYVRRWRMLAAADLLRGSSASVAEVADQVGYGSENAFARAFRRVIGETPGDYRRVAVA